MSLSIRPNRQQALSVKHQLAMLAMPAPKRTRILKSLGRFERAKARKRIRTQTTVDGHKFAARSDGKKTKMLKRMGRRLEPYVKSANRLELKHKAAFTGRIAAMHQEGGTEMMTAGKMKKIHGGPDYGAPCTRPQARALAAEGYRVRKAKGKRYRRATINEIMEKMTLGQAGLVLRLMRNKQTKQRWGIQVSPRPFLGDSTDNVQRQLVKIIEQINN